MPTSDPRLDVFRVAYSALDDHAPDGPDFDRFSGTRIDDLTPDTRTRPGRGVLVAAAVGVLVLLLGLVNLWLSPEPLPPAETLPANTTLPLDESLGHCALGSAAPDLTSDIEIEWTKIEGDVLPITSQIACDPAGGYRASGIDGLYQSDDGLTWTREPGSIEGGFVSYTPSGLWGFSVTNLFPLPGGELYRNEGGAWVEVGPPPTADDPGDEWFWVGPTFEFGDTFFVSGAWYFNDESDKHDEIPLWRSVEGGPFEQVDIISPPYVVLYPHPTEPEGFVRFDPADSYRVYVSTDGKEPIDGGIPEFFRSGNYDFHIESQPGALRAIVTTADDVPIGHWVSSDGMNWTERDVEEIPLFDRPGTGVEETSLGLVEIEWDASPEGTFTEPPTINPGDATFRISTDGGETWSDPIHPPDEPYPDEYGWGIGATGDLLFVYVNSNEPSENVIWIGRITS